MSEHAGPAVHLVMGYDSGPAGRRALFVAVDLCERLGARLHVIHIAEVDDYPVDPDTDGWDERAAEVWRHQRSETAEVLDARDVAWDFAVRRGDPAAVLAGAATESAALMVIIGAPAAGLGAGLEHAVDPSTARVLIRHHGVPVLVVPE